MLQINRNKPYVEAYTYKDILEAKHRELLAQAETQRDRLATLQEVAATYMDDAKAKLVPVNKLKAFSDLNEPEVQANIQAYIFLHALFGFAGGVFALIRRKCDALAKAIHEKDESAEAHCKDDLEDFLIKLENLYNSHITMLMENSGVVGLLRMVHIADCIAPKFDFTVYGNWTLRDIVGTVSTRGYFDLMMYTQLLDAEIPECNTVGEVAENSTMVQIY